MLKIERLTVKFNGERVGTLSLTPDNRLCVFEYDESWLGGGFSISPLELPLKAGTFIARPEPFYGNFGIFEDSLPDGYGRYLLHKSLAREGIDDSSLSSLDRLSLVGDAGMGALTYEPETVIGTESELNDFDLLQAKALEVLAERQDTDAGMLLYNSGNSGGARPKAIFSDKEGHWLVKFRHTYDPMDMGLSEFQYNELARAAGITVPDFKMVADKYFASRRFDISGSGERIHVATSGALLSVSLSQPILDYTNLLALTAYLTHDLKQVEEMFRRMIFNYLSGNKDDHCKNFSFLVKKDSHGKWKWQLAPAYDLTLCAEGYNGEHATSVNGSGRPSMADFIYVGRKFRLSEIKCSEIIMEVSEVCKDIMRYDLR